MESENVLCLNRHKFIYLIILSHVQIHVMLWHRLTYWYFCLLLTRKIFSWKWSLYFQFFLFHDFIYSIWKHSFNLSMKMKLVWCFVSYCSKLNISLIRLSKVNSNFFNQSIMVIYQLIVLFIYFIFYQLLLYIFFKVPILWNCMKMPG